MTGTHHDAGFESGLDSGFDSLLVSVLVSDFASLLPSAEDSLFEAEFASPPAESPDLLGLSLLLPSSLFPARA